MSFELESLASGSSLLSELFLLPCLAFFLLLLPVFVDFLRVYSALAKASLVGT